MKRQLHPQPNLRSEQNGDGEIKVIQLEMLSFFDQKEKRQIIIPYGLGEDGRVYEFTNGRWTQLPAITSETIKQM